MGARVTTEPPVVFTEIGVHAEVEITLDWDGSGDMPLIHIGHEARTTMTFADVESLEQLAAVAAEGARQLQVRFEANKRPVAAEVA